MNISYKRLRSLLASGLGMCELEGREGMMGHPTGLVTFDLVVSRFTNMGDLLSYSKKNE